MNHQNKHFLLYLLPFLLFLCIYYVLGFNGLYGQDPHEYLRYTKVLRQSFFTLEHPGKFYWPFNYPLYGALLSLIVQNVGLALMLVSLFSVIGTAVYTHKLLQLVYEKEAEHYGILAVLVLLVLSPASIKSGFVIMSDILALFLVTGAIYHTFSYLKTGRSKDFWLFAFFTVSAVMTRYTSGVILFVPGLVLLWKWWEQKRLGVLLPALVIGLLCLIPHAILRYQTVSDLMGHNALQHWSLLNLFSRSMQTSEGVLYYRFPNILYALFGFFHPYYLAFGIFLFPFIRLKDYRNNHLLIFALVIFSIYALFLAGISLQNRRYPLSTFPLVILFLYPAFCRLLAFRKKNLWKPLIIGCFVIVQSLFAYYFFHKLLIHNQLEQKIAAHIRPLPHQHIYVMDVDASFGSYGIGEKQAHNLIIKAYDVFEEGSLVIVNSQSVQTQWLGLNPDKNWTLLQEKYELREIERFEKYVLWEIVKKY